MPPRATVLPRGVMWILCVVAAAEGAALAYGIDPSEASSTWAHIDRMALSALVAAAAFLAYAPRSDREHLRVALLGGVVGAGFFVYIAGLRVTWPTETGWLLRLDWQWHYLSWEFFRRDGWHLPPGQIASIFYPSGSSIGLTDAVPLAAFLLKPITAILPSETQYLGAWLFLCFTLQGAVATLLLHRLGLSRVPAAIGAWLFVTSPILLTRIGHVGLSSHWLLLVALLLYFQFRRGTTHAIVWSSLLLLVASLVHPYLLAMTAVLIVAAHAQTAGSAVVVLRATVSAAVAAVVGLWAAGIFVVSNADALKERGLGTYSANLLALVSPEQWSRALPEVPVAFEAQRFEAFAFLGTGPLLLATALAGYGLFRLQRPRDLAESVWRFIATHKWMIGAVALLSVLALGPTYTFASVTIATLPVDRIGFLSAVRVTGRFLWPLACTMMLSAVVLTTRAYGHRAGGALLLAAALFQTWDMAPSHQSRYRDVRADATFFATASSPVEQLDYDGVAHLVFVMPERCGPRPPFKEEIGRQAAIRGLTLNDGHAARIDVASIQRSCNDLLERLRNGQLDRTALYLVTPRHRDLFTGIDCVDLGQIVGCRPR
jgi:Family of unknown function (DUF6311)